MSESLRVSGRRNGRYNRAGERRGGDFPAVLLDRLHRGGALAVHDVQSPGEFAAGHGPGAVNAREER